MDYVAWIRRAKSFLRGLFCLPGSLQVHDWIEEPVVAGDVLEGIDSPTSPLPKEVRAFLKTASARCLFGFSWRPPDGVPPEVMPLAAPTGRIEGGGDLCQNCAYFLAYGGGNERLAEIFSPQNMAEMFDASQAGDLFSHMSHFRPAAESRDFIPILWPSQSDDRVAIGVHGNQRGKVFYVPKDSNHLPTLLASSFDEFLAEWEAMCYPQVSAQSLPALLHKDGRGLDRQSLAVVAFQELLHRMKV